MGSFNKVWTSHSFSNRRRTVSPAPPSNRTLSGTTTAARPLISNGVLTCCTKFNCLLLVDAQKSSRTIVVDSRLTSPSSVAKVTLDDGRGLGIHESNCGSCFFDCLNCFFYSG